MDCNIYEEERIVLTCTVMSGVLDSTLSLGPDNLNIRWFYSNGTVNHESELTVGVNETRRGGGNGDPVEISSALAISGSPEGNVASLAVGSYYCRVQVNDPTMKANSSHSFVAESRDMYLQYATRCSDAEISFSTKESTCAVHSIGTNPTTVNPISSTVDPDSTSSVQEDTSSTLGAGNESTEPSQPPPDRSSGGGTTLQVWIYVLVAVAAVFAMIIIILAIMCVGLCLRRSQTMDANYSKLPS